GAGGFVSAKGAMPSYAITTFGCQMNVHDSERMHEVLRRSGYVEADAASADVIVLNTCSVREKAEQKLRSEVGRLAKQKRTKRGGLAPARARRGGPAGGGAPPKAAPGHRSHHRPPQHQRPPPPPRRSPPRTPAARAHGLRHRRAPLPDSALCRRRLENGLCHH